MCVRYLSNSVCVCVKQMQVWDTAGQERFRTITQSYYRSAHGAMIAYDITRHGTFDSVSNWIREVELYGAANVVLCLIGEWEQKHLLTLCGMGHCFELKCLFYPLYFYN